MAICRIIETGVTPQQYIQLVTQLGVGESNPPPGGTIHIAAEGDDGKMRSLTSGIAGRRPTSGARRS